MNAKETIAETADMARQYAGGDSLEDVAERFGMTAPGVAYRFRTYGYPIRPRGSRGKGRKRKAK